MRLLPIGQQLNSSVTSNIITNVTANKNRRIDLVIGIGYDDDIKKAKLVLNRILKQHDKVLDNPAPNVAVSELADSSVNFIVRPWVKTSDYWGTYFDLTEQIKLTFDTEIRHEMCCKLKPITFQATHLPCMNF